jgi:hypothetical protein
MINLVIIPAFVSMIFSIVLMFSGIPNAEFYSLYVGIWVPTILSFGTLILVAKDKQS